MDGFPRFATLAETVFGLYKSVALFSLLSSHTEWQNLNLAHLIDKNCYTFLPTFSIQKRQNSAMHGAHVITFKSMSLTNVFKSTMDSVLPLCGTLCLVISVILKLLAARGWNLFGSWDPTPA